MLEERYGSLKCIGQEQTEEKSHEECSTSKTCTDLLVTTLKNQEGDKFLILCCFYLGPV